MPLILIDHDPDWIRQADILIAHLSDLLAPKVHRLDHVGSTAVPALAAKPKLHIDIIARNDVPLEEIRDRLLPFGYTDHGYRFSNDEIQMTRPTAGLAGRPAAQSLPSYFRSHRLCICSATCEAPLARRRFRDALKQSADLATQYQQLKRRLAEEAGRLDDWDHYNSGKTAFIRATLAGVGRGSQMN